MPKIAISRLTFAYPGEHNLFTDLTLNIDLSWKLGLIGRNGRGKTTFLKLLEGELPSRGSVSAPFPLEYFPSPILNPELSPLELASLKTGESELGWCLNREVSLLGVAPEALERPFATLSGGERVKILLSLLFLRDATFPLLDEPTRFLDATSARAVAAYLRSKPGFILVSHDRELLDSSIDHVLALEETDAVLNKGDFSAYWENRRLREEKALAVKERLRKDIKRLDEAAKRSAKWASQAEKGKYGQGPVDRGHVGRLAAKGQRRSQNVENRRLKALAEKRELRVREEKPASLAFTPLPFRGGLMAWLKDATLGYGDRKVLENISLSLASGDRLAVTGPNGSGKTLLLKLFTGETRVQAGEFYLPPSLVVSAVPQEPAFGANDLSELARISRVDEPKFNAILRQIGFAREWLARPISSLSQGSRKKVALALSLCASAHLYVWDEPFGHVDLETRMKIEELIIKNKPTLVVVEHDSTFLKNVATFTFSL
ncbi:MAG: ATP-binding cassette domain-containing protein [Deltaproteobacteria bacterium]|jgi:lincosamide and streptogramin A transport system ATP-binding/permease protein|nr:ATP-binding cassette domain-containing protein [Deltaproteobacteria bacterium]